MCNNLIINEHHLRNLIFLLPQDAQYQLPRRARDTAITLFILQRESVGWFGRESAQWSAITELVCQNTHTILGFQTMFGLLERVSCGQTEHRRKCIGTPSTIPQRVAQTSLLLFNKCDYYDFSQSFVLQRATQCPQTTIHNPISTLSMSLDFLSFNYKNVFNKKVIKNITEIHQSGHVDGFWFSSRSEEDPERISE